MAVLRQFSEVELDRLAYIARRDKELIEQTMTNALARAEHALNEERQRAEEERQRAKEAEAAIARLRAAFELGAHSGGLVRRRVIEGQDFNPGEERLQLSATLCGTVGLRRSGQQLVHHGWGSQLCRRAA